jgi:hypothetical protein
MCPGSRPTMASCAERTAGRVAIACRDPFRSLEAAAFRMPVLPVRCWRGASKFSAYSSPDER